MQNSPETDLFNLLVTRDLEPEMLDISGKPVTDPSEAEMFSFDWKTATENYGTVVVLFGANQNLEIFYGNNISKDMNEKDKSAWYQFLKQLKDFSSRNMMTFDVKNLNRLKYTMQSMSKLDESYYGNKKISYCDQPKKTRLVIKHSRPLGEGEARYRYIESLFVETDEGERFKLPFTKLVGGRAMARHIAEGGTPYDEFGQYISKMISEMNVLSRFVRSVRTKNYQNEAADLVETAIRHYSDIKAKAKRIISRRGYQEAVAEFDPRESSNDTLDIDEVRSMFIEQNLDNRIEEALPILVQLSGKKGSSMKEITEFETWAETVAEGTWAVPDNKNAIEKLKSLMADKIPVGVDATNSTELIYDLVGDDKLFDDLYELAQTDSNADARPLIVKRLQELGYDIESTFKMEPASEDIDTDGVMMTKPSTMSNESIDSELLKIKRLALD